MYLVYIYIYPAYGFVTELDCRVKKFIIMDAYNDIDAKNKALYKVRRSIDEMMEKIYENKTKVIKLVNNNGIIEI